MDRARGAFAAGRGRQARGARRASTPSLSATVTARPGAGSWNGNVMSAFSARRRILSLWLPRLPTDRYQAGAAECVAVRGRARPDDTSARVVVTKRTTRCSIYALDDAAARIDLAVGMPLATARAICPPSQVHRCRSRRRTQTLNAIADWCDRFTPLVALDAPHGLLLDITGCAHLFGGEAALLRRSATR